MCQNKLLFVSLCRNMKKSIDHLPHIDVPNRGAHFHHPIPAKQKLERERVDSTVIWDDHLKSNHSNIKG